MEYVFAKKQDHGRSRHNNMVGSPSGLWRLLGKQVYPQGYREFESRPHRQRIEVLLDLIFTKGLFVKDRSFFVQN